MCMCVYVCVCVCMFVWMCACCVSVCTAIVPGAAMCGSFRFVAYLTHALFLFAGPSVRSLPTPPVDYDEVVRLRNTVRDLQRRLYEMEWQRCATLEQDLQAAHRLLRQEGARASAMDGDLRSTQDALARERDTVAALREEVLLAVSAASVREVNVRLCVFVCACA